MPETRVPALQVCCSAKADVLAIGSRSNAMKKDHSRLNSRFSKLLVPSGFRQQIAPSMRAEWDLTEWAISCASCGQGKRVAAAGDEGAVMPPHMRQGQEAVHLGLEGPVRVTMRRNRMGLSRVC